MLIGITLVLTAGTALPVRIILFIPNLLGFIEQVPENTFTFTDNGMIKVSNFEEGNYFAYYWGTGVDPIITIYNSDLSDTIPVRYYHGEAEDFGGDSFAPSTASPLYEFTIGESGTYIVELQSLNGTVDVVPNVSDHNDRVLVISFFVQLLLAVGIVWGVYHWRNKDRLAAEKAQKAVKREGFNTWLDDVTKKNKED